MRIGFTYEKREDFVFRAGDPADAHSEFDRAATVQVISDAIVELGHDLVDIGAPAALIARGRSVADEVDIVFNIAEGYGTASREGWVPSILEALGVPFAGSDAASLNVTLNKGWTKMIVSHSGVRTAPFVLAEGADSIPDPFPLPFPVLAKPNREGSSKGISGDSISRDIAHLRERVDLITRSYRQQALIEAFLPGREFTIPILGTGNGARVFGDVISVTLPGGTGDVYGNEIVFDPYNPYAIAADIAPELRAEIAQLALTAFRAVGCRDFGRVDVRLDADGRPNFLEVNPLPALSREDAFSLAARYEGITYAGMIGAILDEALSRLGMKEQKNES